MLIELACFLGLFKQKQHKLSGWKEQSLSLTPGGCKSEIKVLTAWCSVSAPRKNENLFLSFPLLVTTAMPWFGWYHGKLCLCLLMTFLHFVLFLIRTTSTEFRAHPQTQDDFILITSADLTFKQFPTETSSRYKFEEGTVLLSIGN